MQLSDQQEEFSYAYVHAVATVAGYGFTRSPRVVDNNGIDLTLTGVGDRNMPRKPRLDVQVKCTYQDVKKADHLAYPLETKDHHRLCVEETVPLILVIVLVPETLSDWITHSEDELILRRCGYWLSLSGATPTGNKTRETVHLPRTNRFDPSGLTAIMAKIAARQPL